MFEFRCLTAVLVAPLLAASPRAEETRQLFNGKDLDGWVVEQRPYKDKSNKPTPNWSVNDGLLTCEGKTFGFLRYAKQKFGDFDLHVECRLSPKSNTGIGIRAVPYDPDRDKQTRPSYHSYEIQVQEDEGKTPSKYSTGSLYRYVAPKANPIKRGPDWNTIVIECIGPRIRVTINGQEVLNVDQSKIRQIKDKPLKGYICLQSHTGKVEFRNVCIREIKAPADNQPAARRGDDHERYR
jgi:hypothetical protein